MAMWTVFGFVCMVLVLDRGIDAVRSVLTQEQVDGQVEIHNHYRRLQGSNNMKKIVYDKDMADEAQRWAEECTQGHPSRSWMRGSYGQNCAWASSNYPGVSNMSMFVNWWYNEITDYTYDSNSCKAVCGHYTQVVWADSWKVGCGYKHCNTGHYFTCNYQTPGNYIGRKPFTKGEAATACPNGFTKKDKGLCWNGDKDDGPSGGGAGGGGGGGGGKPDCSNTKCQHCGKVNDADCSCKCKDGYFGSECQYKCEDTKSWCKYLKYRNAFYCTSAGTKYYQFFKNTCPQGCGATCVKFTKEPTC